MNMKYHRILINNLSKSWTQSYYSNQGLVPTWK